MSTIDVLRQLEAALAEQVKVGQPMMEHKARAYAHVIRRLVEDETIAEALKAHDAPPAFDTEAKEFYVALDYAIRSELNELNNSSRPLKQVRAETVSVWKKVVARLSDTSVSKYKTTWTSEVNYWISRIEDNLNYVGLTREEMLRRELARIEPSLGD